MELIYLFIYFPRTEKTKSGKKNAGSWDKHYIEEPFNINRTLPKLYISSCILNSQCVQPLHLLMIDFLILHRHFSLKARLRFVGTVYYRDAANYNKGKDLSHQTVLL